MDEAPTVGFLVWRLSMRWRTAVDQAVEPLGLTHAQYSVLSSLLGMERAGFRPSQRRLADHTGLDPVYVSKLASALERGGLITRKPDPQDTRAVQLAITPIGRELAERAVGIVQDLLERLLAPLGGTASKRTVSFRDDLQTLLNRGAAS
ncbi:MAG TPA: MarR family transcriptional regulator [Acidimicrobiales bacterium]|nr:MarR family transcriptional regulator [Acidimicrobiales bacterium]